MVRIRVRVRICRSDVYRPNGWLPKRHSTLQSRSIWQQSAEKWR